MKPAGKKMAGGAGCACSANRSAFAAYVDPQALPVKDVLLDTNPACGRSQRFLLRRGTARAAAGAEGRLGSEPRAKSLKFGLRHALLLCLGLLLITLKRSVNFSAWL
jgi:hypothetical protein